jgi:hypothetical protein
VDCRVGAGGGIPLSDHGFKEDVDCSVDERENPHGGVDCKVDEGDVLSRSVQGSDEDVDCRVVDETITGGALDVHTLRGDVDCVVGNVKRSHGFVLCHGGEAMVLRHGGNAFEDDPLYVLVLDAEAEEPALVGKIVVKDGPPF